MSKKKNTIYAVVAVLGIVVLGLAASVFAKYISELTAKSGSASIAKWTFGSNNESAVFSCDPAETYDPATLVDGKIAPGTSGTCTIELSNENGEVGVDYTVKVTDISLDGANIQFKHNGTALAKNDTFNGHLDAHSGNTIPTSEVTIDWEWPYYTSAAMDAKDTELGEATGGSDMGIEITITGQQVQPVTQP